MTTAINFDGSALVSGTQSNAMFGEARFHQGEIEGEFYPFSIPGASGIGETWAGNRQRMHVVDVRWITSSETTVFSTVDAYQTTPAYYTLQVVRRNWTRTYPYCRLFHVEWGDITGGEKSNGSAASVIEARLFFLQVR